MFLGLDKLLHHTLRCHIELKMNEIEVEGLLIVLYQSGHRNIQHLIKQDYHNGT